MKPCLSAACFLICLLACQDSSAQVATARLEGVIRDASGRVVPGASISAVHDRTGRTAETSSTREGFFAFPSLPPGFYALSVEAAGFRKLVLSDLELNVGSTLSEDVTLELGPVADSVTVVARPVRVQDADAQIARTVTLREIAVLPQLGRGSIGLAVYNPGVQYNPADPTLSRINGTRQASTNTKLDGMDTNDSLSPRLGLGAAGNPDSIEEFRIVTGGGKAQYGRNAGGQIELVTRSGSNQWHGNAFEFHRNTLLNANTFFNNSTRPAIPRPKFIQNNFGASLGGPLVRNRTFVFVNYNGRRNAQEVSRNRLVLTQQAKAGIFRWQTEGSQEVRELDIAGNDPRGIGIDPQIAAILNLLPDPNNYDHEGADKLNTGGYRFNNPSITSYDDRYCNELTVRVDHDLWNGHRLSVRYTHDRNWFIDVPTSNDARFPGQPHATQGGPRWSYSIGSDWAITPSVANEVRVGYKFYDWDFVRPARLQGPMLLASSWTDPFNPAFSTSRRPPVRQITDTVTAVRQKHTLAGGLDWRFTSEWKSSDEGIWPNVVFTASSSNTPSDAIGPARGGIKPEDRARFLQLYNDLLGRIYRVSQTFYSDLEKFQPAGTPRVRTHRFRDYAYFIQDDWRLHPRFTLNLGVRYEFFGAPVEINGFQGVADKAAEIRQGARLKDITMQRGSRWYRADFNNVAPRIGFAWELPGRSRKVVRANWGVFYDRLIGATTTKVDQFTPGFSQEMRVEPNDRPDLDRRVSDGIPLPTPPVSPTLRLPATRSTDLYLFSPGLRTGYVQHYGLTLQWEVLRSAVIEAGFLGTHGVKLFMNLNLNQPRINEDFLTAFRELQAFRERTPTSNTLVRIFGSADAAVSGIGPSILDQGRVGAAADAMDLNKYNYTRYEKAGVSDFYLRSFPQFKKVVLGTNDGRSYYDSFQLSVRRESGSLKVLANYTFSKSIDNISVDGGTFASPIDNFNVRLNRARGDFDIPHAFNASLSYSLPFGKGRRFAPDASRWMDLLAGGWDSGVLVIWQSGRVVTYLSGLETGPTTEKSYANYNGNRNIGRVMRTGDGVWWLTADEISRFAVPAAGDVGSGGRNAFRSPRFFNTDLSLVKRFALSERNSISFRTEAYNLFNNVNFGAPNASLETSESFGKIANTVGNARVLQLALRFDF